MPSSLPSSILIVVTIVVSAALSFVHEPGTPNGLYLHHLDSTGKPTNQYLGLKPKNIKQLVGRTHPLSEKGYDHYADLHEEPHTHYASRRERFSLDKPSSASQPLPEDSLPILLSRGSNTKPDTNGPIGNEGPDCDPLEVSLNVTLISEAVSDLGMLCDSLQWWYYAVSAVQGDVVAYSCDYGNGNHCDDVSVAQQNKAVDTYCETNVSGWYAVRESKYATGRTAAGEQFCHRGLTSVPSQGQTPDD